MLTFDEFKHTARRMTADAAADIVGKTAFDDLDNIAAVWVYDSRCFIIEETGGSFWAPVEHDDFFGTRDFCETRLYFDFYVHEFDSSEAAAAPVPPKAKLSNLTKHRRRVVDLACDVLCDYAGVGQNFGDLAPDGLTLYATFCGEALAQTARPRSHRDAILDAADLCDGIYLYFATGSSTTCFIFLQWGDGVGECVKDYDAGLNNMDTDDTAKTHIKALLDHVEFLEI